MNKDKFLSFLPLDYPPQKRKGPVKSLPPLVVLALLIGLFVCCIFSEGGKEIIPPHHQTGYYLILSVKVPYLILSLELSFLKRSMALCICVHLYFPRAYPFYINHHSILILFGTSNAG